MARTGQHLESLSVAVLFALTLSMYAAWGLAFVEGGSYYAGLFDARFLEIAVIALTVPPAVLALSVHLWRRLHREADPAAPDASTGAGIAEKPPK